MSKAATDIAEELEFNVELLEFRWPDSITSYANEHLGLIAKHFPFANRRLKKLITLNELLQDGGFGFDVPWVESEGRNNILDRVTKHLLETGEGSNVLHIAGLSGTGKIRLVHHACSTNDELTGTFYAGSFSEFESNRDFLRFLDQSEVSGHLIIDEVPLSKLDSLRGLLRYCVDRVRVVSIGPAPRSQTRKPQDEKILVLNESENESTPDGIIRNSYSGIGDPVRQSIVRASNHDLRLGIMLARATVKNPEFINEPIGGLQDVCDRVTSLFQNQLGDQFADHFQPMTIAFDVGIADDYRQEIEFLSGWFERNIGAMDQAVSKAHECGLGLKTKSFFEPQPGALARWVFEENIWPMVEHRLEELLDAMPIRLNKKFIERCQECIGPKREEIAHRVSGFF
jgi:hypothetical protein